MKDLHTKPIIHIISVLCLNVEECLCSTICILTQKGMMIVLCMQELPLVKARRYRLQCSFATALTLSVRRKRLKLWSLWQSIHVIETVTLRAVMQSGLKSCSAISAFFIIVFQLSPTASIHHLLVERMKQVCHKRKSLYTRGKHRVYDVFIRKRSEQ